MAPIFIDNRLYTFDNYFVTNIHFSFKLNFFAAARTDVIVSFILHTFG